MGGQTLSAWQGAATAAGGSAEDVSSAFSTLSQEAQTASLTGQSKVLPYLRALGINLADANGKAIPMSDVMYRLNRQFSAMDPARATAFGRGMGFSDGFTNFLEMAPDKFHSLIEEQEKYAATAADIEAAQKRQTGWRELLIISTSLGRTILTAVTPAIIGLLDQLKELASQPWIKDEIVATVNRFSAWLKDPETKKSLKEFGADLLVLVSAAAAIAVAFATQSPMMVAFEGFATLLGLRILLPLRAIVAAMSALGSMPLTGALAALVATTTSANAGEPQVGPGGRLTYPDGHSEQGHVWDGHSQGTAPADTRNWWQRTAPKWAGGQDAPMVTHGAHGASLGERRGSDAPVSSAGAPGANGYGLIDASYKAPLDRKGEGGHLAPRELFDYLKSKGATDNEATMLTGAAGSESSFNPNAIHDGGHGHGLWGHNDARIDMRGRNWQQQADAALNEVQRGGYAASVNAARTPQELADAEMHYERPRGYHRNNPRGGDNYTGRMHTIDRFSQGFGTLGHGVSAPSGVLLAQAAGTPIGDAAMLAAEQRRAAGKALPGDASLMETYRRQQAMPEHRMASLPHPISHTYDSAANSLFRAYHESKHRDPNKPVTVELTDRSAGVIYGNGALYARARAAVDQHSKAMTRGVFGGQAWNGMPDAAHHVGMGTRVAAMQQDARHSSTTHNVDNRIENNVGDVHVHTQATDAKGIVADIGPQLRRRSLVTQANTGLA